MYEGRLRRLAGVTGLTVAADGADASAGGIVEHFFASKAQTQVWQETAREAEAKLAELRKAHASMLEQLHDLSCTPPTAPVAAGGPVGGASEDFRERGAGRGDEGANWRELTEEAKSKLAAAASAEHEVLQRVGRKRALITAVRIGVTVFNGLVGSLSNDVGILSAGGEEGSHAELPAIPLFSQVPPSSDHAMADEGEGDLDGEGVRNAVQGLHKSKELLAAALQLIQEAEGREGDGHLDRATSTAVVSTHGASSSALSAGDAASEHLGSISRAASNDDDLSRSVSVEGHSFDASRQQRNEDDGLVGSRAAGAGGAGGLGSPCCSPTRSFADVWSGGAYRCIMRVFVECIDTRTDRPDTSLHACMHAYTHAHVSWAHSNARPCIAGSFVERPYSINAAKTAGAHPRVRTDAIFDSMQRLSASRLSRSPQSLGHETVGAGADEGHGALSRSGGAGDVPGFSNDDVSESSDEEEEEEGGGGGGMQAGHEALGAADEGGSEVWLMQSDVRVCARSCA